MSYQLMVNNLRDTKGPLVHLTISVPCFSFPVNKKSGIEILQKPLDRKTGFQVLSPKEPGNEAQAKCKTCATELRLIGVFKDDPDESEQ